MRSDQDAQAARATLNGKEVGGRNLTVTEARYPTARGGRDGSRGGNGGGGRPSQTGQGGVPTR